MIASGAQRHAQHRRLAPVSATPAALGQLEGTGLRGGYHNQSITLLVSASEMEDMIAVANLLATRTGRLVKNSAIMRFALIQLASRLRQGAAERDLIVDDYINFMREVTAARREHRAGKGGDE